MNEFATAIKLATVQERRNRMRRHVALHHHKMKHLGSHFKQPEASGSVGPFDPSDFKSEQEFKEFIESRLRQAFGDMAGEVHVMEMPSQDEMEEAKAEALHDQFKKGGPKGHAH